MPILKPRVLLACVMISGSLVTLLSSLKPVSDASAQTDETVNVLFIGHSWFQGAHRELNVLTENAGDFWANGVYHGGYSLFNQWRDEEQMAKIRAELERGIYDYAAVMDFAGAVANRQNGFIHNTYVGHFKDLFDSYGVQTVLVLPWAYITEPELQPTITTNEYALGADLGVLVSPVGEAFRLSAEERPELQLLLGNGNSHPNAVGDYLRNLVLYASIMGRTPAGLAGIEDLSEADENFLKVIAWKTIQTWNPTPTPTPVPATATPSATLTPKPPSPTPTPSPSPVRPEKQTATPADTNPQPPVRGSERDTAILPFAVGAVVFLVLAIGWWLGRGRQRPDL